MTNPHLRHAKSRVGAKAGKYTLRRLIDVGGMAAVYAGKSWRSHVAIKVLHRTYMRMDEARTRFAREGYAANSVGHPGVVEVIDHGEMDDGAPFFVMDLLVGQSLEQQIQETTGPLPLTEVLWVADEVLDVLCAAHANGIIHRDIKPGNVFITSDRKIKVLDFGLACILDGTASERLTTTGTVIGTAHYMSPEQALHKPELVDQRTDLWSLGAIMFRMLTGRLVHNVRSIGQSLVAAATKKAPPVARIIPDVAPEVAMVIDKALAFKKDDRFTSAVNMQRAVRQCGDTNSEEFDWDALKAASRTEPTGVDNTPIGVTFTESASGDSVIVKFDDESGLHPGRYRVRTRDSEPVPDSGLDVPIDDD